MFYCKQCKDRIHLMQERYVLAGPDMFCGNQCQIDYLKSKKTKKAKKAKKKDRYNRKFTCLECDNTTFYMPFGCKCDCGGVVKFKSFS